MMNKLKLKIKGYSSIILFLSGVNTLVYPQGINYSLTPQTKIEHEKLKEGFLTVPDECKLRNFWLWMNGVATKTSITQDLEAMKTKGFGGAIIADNGAPVGPVGPTFMSREWLDLFAHAVKEADRLGIELSINIESGMGDPGNPNIQPDNGMKKIVFGETKVVGPGEIRIELPIVHSPIYYKDIAVQAFRSDTSGNATGSTIKNWNIKSMNEEVPWKKEDDKYAMYLLNDDFQDSNYTSIDPTQLIDLSDHFSEGILTWDVPPGQWTIIRYGMTATGKKNNYGSPGYRGGLCYDQINKRGVEAQWNDVAKPLIEIAQKAGNSLKFVHTDSWEMGLTNWTHGFNEVFKKHRGYAISSYLPVLTNKIVDNREVSNRFLEDYRLTIGELVADKNYAVLRDLAHANGVFSHSESGGPHAAPIDGLQTLGRNDIPIGEFWGRSDTHRTTEGSRLVVKQGSCAAHVYGKRFFGAEGPTTVGPAWERSPRDLKGIIDQVFCNGVNRIYWHTYTSSPDEYGLPGVEYFAGTHFNRKVTWWNQSGSFVNYINRCQFMLSQGLYVADVLNYFGSGVPNYVFTDKDIKGIPPEYAWDMCNSEVLLTRASVKNGQIYLPDGMSYALLSLSDHKDISLSVLKKIEQMVQEGIILVGNPPERAFGLSEYPESDQEVKAIVKKLWGKVDQKTIFKNTYGKGKVYGGKTIAEVLNLENIVPDFTYTATTPNAGMQYIHRSSDNIEIYFVTNKWARNGIDDFIYRYQTNLPDHYIQATCSFRVDGEREIERWDPLTGEMTQVTVYRHENERYYIPVSLSPEGSAFFVFKKSPEKKHIIKIGIDGQILTEGNDPLLSGASRVFTQNNHVEIMQDGNYQFTWNNGKTATINTRQIPKEQTLEGNWEIRFPENPALGKPIDTEIDSLKSWTEFSQRSIKYYSGTARYTKTFNLPKGILVKGRVYLDLGNVQELASIRINGKGVSICWIAPFRADISDYLKPGENSLEIDVTNLWSNRLIGDGKLSPKERGTQTNIAKFNSPDAEKYLRISGLLGPVKLQFSQVLNFK